LRGTFPKEVGYLSTLVVMNFGTSVILSWQESAIPSPSKEPSPSHIVPFIQSIEENEIVGTIPTELGLLTNLKNMQLGKQHQRGKKADRLELDGISYDYKSFIFSCIFVEDNKFEGALPTEFGGLTNLEEMVLRKSTYLVLYL
jgi:hypothetical protein